MTETSVPDDSGLVGVRQFGRQLDVVRRRYHAVFEDARKVEGHDDDDDAHDVGDRLVVGPEGRRRVRSADRPITVGGNEDNEPDNHTHRHGDDFRLLII